MSAEIHLRYYMLYKFKKDSSYLKAASNICSIKANFIDHGQKCVTLTWQYML